jgi:protein-S-isoprenylcysteine O-methyltransferase Ste14
VIVPPPLLYLTPLLASALLDRLVPLPGLPPAARRFGSALAAAGVALSGWFVRTMHAAKTPIDPRQTPTAIVTHGPFQHTRNPGYLGLALIYAGVSLRTNRRWALVLLPGVLAVLDRGVVRREERYLREKFGDEYAEYQRRVPRWL